MGQRDGTSCSCFGEFTGVGTAQADARQPHLQSLASLSRLGCRDLPQGVGSPLQLPPVAGYQCRAGSGPGLGVGETEAKDARQILGPRKVSHRSLLPHMRPHPTWPCFGATHARFIAGPTIVPEGNDWVPNPPASWPRPGRSDARQAGELNRSQ